MPTCVRLHAWLLLQAGVTYCHMGAGAAGLAPLREVLATSEIPIANIIPTHMSRSAQLVNEVRAAAAWHTTHVACRLHHC
jgi:hypothetical protein